MRHLNIFQIKFMQMPKNDRKVNARELEQRQQSLFIIIIMVSN